MEKRFLQYCLGKTWTTRIRLKSDEKKTWKVKLNWLTWVNKWKKKINKETEECLS